MKLLAFAASNNPNSINKKLVNYAVSVLQTNNSNITVNNIDLNNYEMPIYSPALEEKNGIVQQAKDFFNAIGQADAVLVSFAEYNGIYTSAYLNLFHWASRINTKVYQDKPCFFMSTSPGKNGASSVLQLAVNAAPFIGVNLKDTFSLPAFYTNFDVENNIISNVEHNTTLLNKLKLFNVA